MTRVLHLLIELEQCAGFPASLLVASYLWFSRKQRAAPVDEPEIIGDGLDDPNYRRYPMPEPAR